MCGVRWCLSITLPLPLYHGLGPQAGVASSVFDLGATGGGILFGIVADHERMGSGSHRLLVALVLCVSCAGEPPGCCALAVHLSAYWLFINCILAAN